MESVFKIKTFKSLKEVMESFSILKPLGVTLEIDEVLFGIKNFKAVMVSFFSINNFKSRKKVMESFFQY